MSLFGDLHQLSAGLELVERLVKATEELTKVCEKLNDNVEHLVEAVEQQNQLLTTKEKKAKVSK